MKINKYLCNEKKSVDKKNRFKFPLKDIEYKNRKNKLTLPESCNKHLEEYSIPVWLVNTTLDCKCSCD